MELITNDFSHNGSKEDGHIKHLNKLIQENHRVSLLVVVECTSIEQILHEAFKLNKVW